MNPRASEEREYSLVGVVRRRRRRSRHPFLSVRRRPVVARGRVVLFIRCPAVCSVLLFVAVAVASLRQRQIVVSGISPSHRELRASSALAVGGCRSAYYY